MKNHDLDLVIKDLESLLLHRYTILDISFYLKRYIDNNQNSNSILVNDLLITSKIEAVLNKYNVIIDESRSSEHGRDDTILKNGHDQFTTYWYNGFVEKGKYLALEREINSFLYSAEFKNIEYTATLSDTGVKQFAINNRDDIYNELPLIGCDYIIEAMKNSRGNDDVQGSRFLLFYMKIIRMQMVSFVSSVAYHLMECGAKQEQELGDFLFNLMPFNNERILVLETLRMMNRFPHLQVERPLEYRAINRLALEFQHGNPPSL